MVDRSDSHWNISYEGNWIYSIFYLGKMDASPIQV